MDFFFFFFFFFFLLEKFYLKEWTPRIVFNGTPPWFCVWSGVLFLDSRSRIFVCQTFCNYQVSVRVGACSCR